MNHRIGGRKFGLPSDQRRALLKGLVRALLTYQTINTTDTRAKDVRSIAEKLIANARNDSLHARRQARRFLTDETLVHHLFTEIAPEFRNIPGGFTRTVKIGQRRGDAATIVQLSLATDKQFGLPVVPDKIGTVRKA
jgi:large subunit ribosomal protein L17